MQAAWGVGLRGLVEPTKWTHKYHVTILYMYGMACKTCSWELWQRKEELWLL